MSSAHIWRWPMFLSASDETQKELKYDIRWLAVLAMTHVLASFSWWSRSWVVQEVILSKHRTVLYGRYSCSWSNLVRYAKEIRRHGYTCCSNSWGHLPIHHWPVLSDIFYKLTDIDKVSQLKHESSGLDQVIPQFRHRQATDARDKIYAFLGFVPADQISLVTIDYAQDVASLYVKFALTCIRTSGNLNILALKDFQNRSQSKIVSLPSWVPDWSISLTSERHDYQGGDDNPESMYNACGLKSFDLGTVQLLADGRTLAIRGMRLSEVASLCRPQEKIKYKDIFGLLRDWASFSGVTLPFDDDLKPEHVRFWMTCFAGCVATFSDESQEWSVRRCILEDQAIWNSLWHSIEQDANENYHAGDIPGQADDVDQAAEDETFIRSGDVSFGTACQDRRMFLSKEGHLGLGPRSMSEGDQIWIVDGARRPFIFRQVRSDESILHTNRFELIGPCYVHGCMDGEAITANAIFETVYLV